MQLIDKNNHNEIKKIIQYLKYKKILIVSGSSSFSSSKAEKILSEKEEMKIEVNRAKGNKCPRCWKILEENCMRCSNLI